MALCEFKELDRVVGVGVRLCGKGKAHSMHVIS